jgi:hypothetical protein
MKVATHVVTAQNTHYFAASIELDENALLEVLFKVRLRPSSRSQQAHLLQLGLCLRHDGECDVRVGPVDVEVTAEEVVELIW